MMERTTMGTSPSLSGYTTSAGNPSKFSDHRKMAASYNGGISHLATIFPLNPASLSDVRSLSVFMGHFFGSEVVVGVGFVMPNVARALFMSDAILCSHFAPHTHRSNFLPGGRCLFIPFFRQNHHDASSRVLFGILRSCRWRSPL